MFSLNEAANMPRTRVLVIGCGITGPVIATLLARKGYEPVIYEKVRQLGDAGASLMLMPNGMKVLNLVGLTEEIYKSAFPLRTYEDFTAAGEMLGTSTLPSSYQAKYSQHATGVMRASLNLALKNLCLKQGLEVHEGYELVNISESLDSVTAHFKNGHTATGALLIGCDGIKAASRIALLNQFNPSSALIPPPSFTGLTQTSGHSPMPATFGAPGLKNWYGDAAHVISYPVSPTEVSWAITLPESDETQARESWRLYTPTEIREQRSILSARLAGFEPRVLEMINSCDRLIKYGLYDREELTSSQWFSKRCVLVGDAAHPTSPHLGQGANQALEDSYWLAELLPDVPMGDSGQQSASEGVDFERLFRQYAEKRQPRTSKLVRGARAVGEKRVERGGREACVGRDERVREEWRDIKAVEAKFDALCQEPFQV